MAFRRVTQEVADQMAAIAANQAEVIRRRHIAAVADLLKLADAPADANAALAAAAKWRADREHREQHWRNEALLQITSGDRPEDVCAELSIGRTALQQAVRAEGSELGAFEEFLWRSRPKRKKEIA